MCKGDFVIFIFLVFNICVSNSIFEDNYVCYGILLMFIYLFVIIRFISIDCYVFSRVIVIVWRVLIRVLEIIIVYDLCKIIVVC